MKTTVSEHDFIQAFDDMDRAENFSYQGRAALFEYLEELERDTGEEMELDVIGVCCDFQEWENLAEFQENYGEEYETLDDIRDHATVIGIDDSERFITQAF